MRSLDSFRSMVIKVYFNTYHRFQELVLNVLFFLTDEFELIEIKNHVY